MNRNRIVLPLGAAALFGVAFLVPEKSPALGPVFPWVESDSETVYPVRWGVFKRKRKAPPKTGPVRQPVARKVAEPFPIDLAVITSTGDSTSLRAIMESTKSRAVLIDFWASWCGPCMAGMPKLKARSEALSRVGIAVAGMNVEGNPRVAENVRQHQRIGFPWLMEPAGEPLSRQFRIDSIPRVLLVSRNGDVLFNGHPNDAALEQALEAMRGQPPVADRVTP